MQPIIVEFMGESIPLAQLAIVHNVKGPTVYRRFRNGLRGPALVAPIERRARRVREKRVRVPVGKQHSRLRQIWRCMHGRCRAKQGFAAKYYFARGIGVCAEWSVFQTFKTWALANGYADGLELDRKDNSNGYSPINCRWASRTQQMANTRKRRQANRTSQYKGVQRIKTSRIKPWRAIITIEGRPKHLGCFATEQEAARAYDARAVELYGEFASTNFGTDASKEMSPF